MVSQLPKEVTNMPTLETDRLVIREIVGSDEAFLLSFFSDSRMMRLYPLVKTDAHVANWLKFQKESYLNDGHGIWLAITKDTGLPEGVCGLSLCEVNGKSEIAYNFAFTRCLIGRGYAEVRAKPVWITQKQS